METVNKQIKTKERIANHGEVFTAEREVNAMLDLVKQETERIESRFLEPACGTGNFLAEIIRRKLTIVKNRYAKNKADYEKYAFLAMTSIYGVDILEDNIDECQDRLLSIFIEEYKTVFKEKMGSEYIEAIQYVLSRNILHGDALSMKNIHGEPIVFSEWSLVSGNMIKRRDYRFEEMIEEDNPFNRKYNYMEETSAFIPEPIKEYSLVDYRRVQHVK